MRSSYYFPDSKYVVREIQTRAVRCWVWIKTGKSWSGLFGRIARALPAIVLTLSFIGLSSEAPIIFTVFTVSLYTCLVVFGRRMRPRYWKHLVYVPLIIIAATESLKRLSGTPWQEIRDSIFGMTSLVYALLIAFFIYSLIQAEREKGGGGSRE